MPLVKLVGIFLIFVVCCAIGFLKSISLKNRSKKLLAFFDGLNTLYEYIEQGGTQLILAVENSFSKCAFLQIKENKILCLDNDLNNEEKTLINEFFNRLGSSVKKIECERISSLKIKIKALLKDAENDALQKSKIYQTFGVCMGLTIGILLI